MTQRTSLISFFFYFLQCQFEAFWFGFLMAIENIFVILFVLDFSLSITLRITTSIWYFFYLLHRWHFNIEVFSCFFTKSEKFFVLNIVWRLLYVLNYHMLFRDLAHRFLNQGMNILGVQVFKCFTIFLKLFTVFSGGYFRFVFTFRCFFWEDAVELTVFSTMLFQVSLFYHSNITLNFKLTETFYN